MIKALKILSWFYLTAYILAVILMLSLEAINDTLSLTLFIQSSIIIIPAIILIRYLRKHYAHTWLHIIGATIALYPLTNAYAFISMPGVTAMFYIWFAPMAIILLLTAVLDYREKHNKSSNLTGANDAPPS